MDFDLTEEQAAVADLARTILAERGADERYGPDGWFDRETWTALAEAGLLGIALPVEHGGGGLGPVERHLLLEQVGAAAAPVPAWETLGMAAGAIARGDDVDAQATWLPRVVDGSAVLTAALVDEPRSELLTPATSLTGAGAAARLNGAKTAVPCGAIADAIVVTATRPDGTPAVVLVEPDADGVEVRPQEVVDHSPQAGLRFVDAPVAAVLGGPGAVRALVDEARATMASVQSGVCQQALRMAAGHTSQRHQFGRPIATFQAVAHRVADAFIDAEGVRLTSLEAAWRLAERPPATDSVDVAAWWAATAGHRVLHAVQHVHGGIGVDHGYPLHRYYRLTKRLEFCLGGAAEPLRSLGRALASQPA